MLVEQAKLLDRDAALVGQQWVADFVLVGEPSECLDRVVADSVDGDAFTLEIVHPALQLDELRAAEWSPVGAAVKDDQPFAARSMIVQAHLFAELIR